ncbi:IS481 family transposase [Pedococcus sp. NPDC057267]|uniref:IS481 family transposase n=1 Tax=Pedococcus sp. NPDC057267 TaxID=3346077 RepID=UPI003634449A
MLSVVEQRLDAVRAVLAGAEVSEVAALVGVHRSTVHRWVGRYLSDQLGGLVDRSHRPVSCPHQVPASVEVLVAEMRREHPRWGARRIRLELLRTPPSAGVTVPAVRTIVRILHRQGLSAPRPRKRPRSSYVRFERPGPMQLWGIDIVGGVQLVDTTIGEVREVKVVTGVDDHSRFCVMAEVVERATGRAVCLAFARALARYGAPQQVITDNGKQFTDRFSRYGPSRGEVLFDKICRRNGIEHLLTAPASPNQNGKVERFHGTFRPEFLTEAGPFESVQEAQVAVDAWVAAYNTDRPHQGLDPDSPVTPADRFAPVPQVEREALTLWLPPALTPTGPDPAGGVEEPAVSSMPRSGVSAPGTAGPVEFDKVVPPSGMITVAGKLLWLGTYRAGKSVRVWADTQVIHLLVDGARVKSLRSHLSVADLSVLVAQGAVPAGAPPLPAPDGSDAVEVDRVVNRVGTISLGNHAVLAAEILAGRQVSVRIEPELLMIFDPDTRELLRTRPNPLTPQDLQHVRGTRLAGPPPRPTLEPVRVQRRASNTGVIMVAEQKIALGRTHAGHTVTVTASETTISVDLPDGDTRTFRRTTTAAVRSIKGQRPRTADTSGS